MSGFSFVICVAIVLIFLYPEQLIGLLVTHLRLLMEKFNT